MKEIIGRILTSTVSVIAVIFVLLLSVTIILTLKHSTDADKVLAGDRRRRWFVYELLRTSFRSSYVMRGLILPYNPAVPGDGTVNIETLLVTRGGVLVISTLRMSGYVDNPAHSDWIQYVGGKIYRMRNPAELNEANVRAVRNLLRAENISNVRVHSLLVCPDPSVQFKYNSDVIVSADNLLNYIRDIGKVSFITLRDMPNVAAAIRKYRIVPQNRQNKINGQAH